jgi:hypothetical protein
MPFSHKPESPGRSFFSTARSLCGKTVTTIGAILSHSAMLFSLGNNALAYGEGSLPGLAIWGIGPGLAIGAIGTLAIALTILIEKITGKERGMPYGVLAAVNFLTAAAILTSALFASATAGAMLGPIASAACLTVWGIGHIFRRIHARHGTKPQSLLETPNFYTASADMIASIKCGLINPLFFITTPFFLLGMIAAMRRENKNQDVRTMFDFAKKHVTSSRILAFGYMIQSLALAAIKGPAYFIAATALWAIGFIPLDKDKNKELIPDARRVVRHALPTTPNP